MPLSPRARAQAIARSAGKGPGGGRHTLAVPLAPRLAARIAERPFDAFLTDPTQLANGLADLLAAAGPDGVAVTLPAFLADDDGAHREAALEATRRLRASQGDGAVLLAVLDGGRADLVDLVTAFLDAGADGIVLDGRTNPVDPSVARTVGNLTRFHRAMAHVVGAEVPGLASAGVQPHTAPTATTGLVLTDGECPPDADVTTVIEWVAAVRG